MIEQAVELLLVAFASGLGVGLFLRLVAASS